MTVTTTPTDIFSTSEAARLLGIPESTLRHYSRQGVFIEPYVVVGKRRGWRRTDLLAWVASTGRVPVTPEGATPVPSTSSST